MLIVERTSNGRTVVRLHKDWNPGRISLGWIPPPKNYEQSVVEFALQTQYLKKFRRK